MDIRTLYKSIDKTKIQELVTDRQEEDLFLDFKIANSSDFSNRDDRKTFAKALSGFANSSGGLIVWGVKARKNDQGIDCACGSSEIENVRLFVSKLNEHTGQFVDPIVEGIQHRRITTSGDKGFAITMVPESDSGPHMAKAGENRYYKRSGDSFYKMEHFDIEDMFGRRKKPKLRLYTRALGLNKIRSGDHYVCSLIVGIKNDGRGTAKYPYISLKVNSPYEIDRCGLDGNSNTGLPRIYQGFGAEGYVFGADVNVVIHPGQRLEVTRITFDRKVDTSLSDDLEIRWAISAEDFGLVEDSTIIRCSDLEEQAKR